MCDGELPEQSSHRGIDESGWERRRDLECGHVVDLVVGPWPRLGAGTVDDIGDLPGRGHLGGLAPLEAAYEASERACQLAVRYGVLDAVHRMEQIGLDRSGPDRGDVDAEG